MSETKLSNQNGSTTTFNFKLDNGLYIFLTRYEEEKIKNVLIQDCNYFEDDKSIWLSINEVYLVLGDLSDIIIKELISGRLNFFLLREDESLIKGFKLR